MTNRVEIVVHAILFDEGRPWIDGTSVDILFEKEVIEYLRRIQRMKEDEFLKLQGGHPFANARLVK